VIATLLVVIAIVAGVAVYGFVMGWIGGATKSIGFQRDLALDYIDNDVNNDIITAYVRNVGDVAETVSIAYIEVLDESVTQITIAGVIALSTHKKLS